MTETTRHRDFIATKEHRRFVEFAQAVRRHRYIGLCYGAAGVGKTLSARRLTGWDVVEPMIDEWQRIDINEPSYVTLERTRAIFHTPPVSCSFATLKSDLSRLIVRSEICIDEYLGRHEPGHQPQATKNHIDLMIIDEAERLSYSALEYVRDLYDRKGFGVILIGMPGMEKRLSQYPQLYSRIGFAHTYRSLQGDELTFVLTRHWRRLGLALDDADFTDNQAIASIARITGGDFPLLPRLFVRISRIFKKHWLPVITDGGGHAARSTLVIGAT